jgi:hypothetical protein
VLGAAKEGAATLYPTSRRALGAGQSPQPPHSQCERARRWCRVGVVHVTRTHGWRAQPLRQTAQWARWVTCSILAWYHYIY